MIRLSPGRSTNTSYSIDMSGSATLSAPRAGASAVIERTPIVPRPSIARRPAADRSTAACASTVMRAWRASRAFE